MPIQILMPALSPTMTEGNLVKWHKNAGDTIKAGMVLAEIETDKATMEVEAVDEGILGKILIPEGTESVAVNSVIALLLEAGEDASACDAFEAIAPSAPVSSVVETGAAAITVATPMFQNQGRIAATPLARRIALEKKIDLSHIQGSGPHGRIVRADVDNAKTFTPQTPVMITGDAPFTLQPLNNIRKIVARKLTESKQLAPHFYLSISCEMDALMSFRKGLNEHPLCPTKISVNDFVIRACALSLMDVPAANAMWNDTDIKLFSRADISVAVAIDGGLVTPIIRGANLKSTADISLEMKDLAKKARAGTLKPEDFQGGTFTISNLGMFGIENFSAIINYPQAAILAVGASQERVVVKNGAMQIASVMECTLSVDHRAIDGAVGAEFLARFKNYMENPFQLLVWPAAT